MPRKVDTAFAALRAVDFLATRARRRTRRIGGTRFTDRGTTRGLPGKKEPQGMREASIVFPLSFHRSRTENPARSPASRPRRTTLDDDRGVSPCRVFAPNRGFSMIFVVRGRKVASMVPVPAKLAYFLHFSLGSRARPAAYPFAGRAANADTAAHLADGFLSSPFGSGRCPGPRGCGYTCDRLESFAQRDLVLLLCTARNGFRFSPCQVATTPLSARRLSCILGDDPSWSRMDPILGEANRRSRESSERVASTLINFFCTGSKSRRHSESALGGRCTRADTSTLKCEVEVTAEGSDVHGDDRGWRELGRDACRYVR